MYVAKETSGRYEAVDTIADGAMGTVLLARDRLLDRLVAIKTVRLRGIGDPGERQRLHEALNREAQVVQLLAHPNIVTVHDIIEGVDGQPPSLVMEYVQGTSLDTFLKGGKPLPLDFAVSAATQIAEALDHAHSMGVVHGDIKPSNVLVTDEDERVKLVDFGIARLLGLERRANGRPYGTPRYVSPEQLHGHGPDARSDLFSLGVVLYEMLTGRSPFDGDSASAIAKAISRGTADLSEDALAQVPDHLRVALRRALEKDPASRFQTAREMAGALTESAAGSEAGAAAVTQDLSALVAPDLGYTAAASDGGDAAERPSETRAGATATEGVSKVRRDPPSIRRLMWLAGGTLALSLSLAVGLFGLLSRGGSIDARSSQEHHVRRQVMVLAREGHRLLRAGEPKVAARIFERAERLAPDNERIARLRQRAEQEARDLKAYREISEKVRSLLDRSRGALDAGRPGRALQLAREALSLEPENLEARMLVESARSSGVKRARARPAASDSSPSAEARPEPIPRPPATSVSTETVRSDGRQPTSVQPSPRTSASTTSHSTPPTPEVQVAAPRTRFDTRSGSKIADLRIDVFSYLPKGVLTVYAGQEQILLEPFRFVQRQGLLRRKKTAGRIETALRLPAGPTDFRIYVAADGQDTETVNLSADLSGGQTHVLRLVIAENGSASAQLN